MYMKNEVHIGELIKQKLLESELSISDFAAAIHKTRTTVYDIFNRKSIDIDLLVLISDILHFDFISHLRHASDDSSPHDAHPQYLVVKIVEESELEKEAPLLFSYKLKR